MKHVLSIIAAIALVGCTSLDMAEHDQCEHALPSGTVAASAGPSHSDYAWKTLRKEWIGENPRCAVCGIKSKKNQVHHRIPRNARPDLFLARSNLITMCHRHHWWVGHARNYRTYNTNLVGSIDAFHEAAKEIQGHE